MKGVRTVFAGTPAFAVPALKALIASGHRPLAVMTQPDRAAGRGRRVRPGPVKQLAVDAGIEVLQPQSLKTPEARARLAELKPELLITAAYGLLLPRAVLELPDHGCWNLHASLLPRWRGASPIQQAVLAGDRKTGVSLMQMEIGLDTGPVILAAETPIAESDSAGTLHDRLAGMAAVVLAEALDRLVRGDLPAPRPQNAALATHAPLIQRKDAELDWRQDAERLARMVRAYNPWPVAHTCLDGQTLRVLRARAVAGPSAPVSPGGRLHDRPGQLIVACGRDALELLEVQAPGRRVVSARDWLNAHPEME
ncbi:MAG: methionyl-tRNA formyltransferase [Gammaproteobacteria bacterium]|nr:methionyl-tRNA formyltransferase [Gammaproteobacteria bacterium]